MAISMFFAMVSVGFAAKACLEAEEMEKFWGFPQLFEPKGPHKLRVEWYFGVEQVSNEKNPGWLGYIGDDKLPSYIGIIINRYKDPY